jgi:hypothetical protein
VKFGKLHTLDQYAKNASAKATMYKTPLKSEAKKSGRDWPWM